MKETIGAVQLGEKTDKKFITSLLPSEYTEEVYEHDRYYACRCINNKRQYMDGKDGEDGTWERFCKKLREEFGSNLMEIHSITSQGAHFVIYLKK
jgi:hypothetical protein